MNMPALETDLIWRRVCTLADIPPLGARTLDHPTHGTIAVFRTAEDEVFALLDKCPHKGGPLSAGIVHGRSVTCPLHNWKIRFEDGEALEPDVGCAKKFDTKVEGDEVFVAL